MEEVKNYYAGRRLISMEEDTSLVWRKSKIIMQEGTSLVWRKTLVSMQEGRGRQRKAVIRLILTLNDY